MIISVINHTQLTKEDVQRTLRAVNRQMSEDFKRYWHRDVELRLEGWTGAQPNAKMPIDMRGDAVLYLWDEEDVDDALGYHALNGAGVPFGFVFTRLSEQLGEPWSVTLSHEVLEMAIDPEANLLAQGPHPDPSEDGRIVYHWYELCDVVQGHTYEIDGVEVADFVLPLYFTEGDEHQNHNDFLGTSLPSFRVGEGGYAGFFDPETGRHETWLRPEDAVAADRLGLKQQYRGIQRSDRHKGGDGRAAIHDANVVHCDAIVFELGLKSPKTELLKHAQHVARTVLGDSWAVQRVRGDPREFDAVYQGTVAIGFSKAWDLAHSLAEDSSVAFAEPSLSYPVVGESDRAGDERPAALRASSAGGDHLNGSNVPGWGLDLCRVPEAWGVIRGDGKLPGDDVRIGHPDSGYRPHDEMDAARVLSQIDYDFLDRDEVASSTKGNHGLATASVIMSGSGSHGDQIRGPALHADIVPLRVTKPGWIRPAPVLIGGGMRRLRDAIDYAVRVGCSVISMSLGGLPSSTVKKAVGRATDAGLIVLAAAGNQVRVVVWPARYDDVIAVAGCNIHKKPWSGSSRGAAVDITAPAESVWRAYYNRLGQPDVGRSHGTSYAVALTAGVAAIWVAFHGRAVLTDKYGAEQIHHVFWKLLMKTANPEHHLPSGKFGAGIVNAEALLSEPLPDPDSHVHAAGVRDQGLRAAIREQGLDRQLGIDLHTLGDSLAQELLSAEVLGAFVVPEQVARARLAAKTPRRVPTQGLSGRLRQMLKP